jgi:hypothetical protein
MNGAMAVIPSTINRNDLSGLYFALPMDGIIITMKVKKQEPVSMPRNAFLAL